MVMGRVGQLCAEADTAARKQRRQDGDDPGHDFFHWIRTNGAALMPKSFAFD